MQTILGRSTKERKNEKVLLLCGEDYRRTSTGCEDNRTNFSGCAVAMRGLTLNLRTELPETLSSWTRPLGYNQMYGI